MNKYYYLCVAVIVVALAVASTVDNCSEDRALVDCVRAGGTPESCICAIDGRCDKQGAPHASDQ